MSEKLRPILTALALILALGFWVTYCHDPSVRAGQRLRDSTVTVDAHRDSTDRRVAALAAESLELGGKLRRLARNDSVARGEIARLKAKIPQGGRLAEPHPADLASADTGGVVPAPEAEPAPPVGCAGAPAACDTLIATLLESRTADSTEKTIWRALAVERGALLQRALQERDAYRRIAIAWSQKAGKRFGCTAGPGVVVTIDGHVSAGAGFVCGFRV